MQRHRTKAAVRRASEVVVLVAAFGGVARAQDSSATAARAAKVGELLRFVGGGAFGSNLEGRLIETRGDTFVVRTVRESLRVAIARDEFRELQVYRREHESQVAMAALGTVGALGGLGYYVQWCRRNSDACGNDLQNTFNPPPDDDEPFSMLKTLVAAGGLTGVLLGYALAFPTWEKVQIPARLSVAPLGTNGVFVMASLPVGRRAGPR